MKINLIKLLIPILFLNICFVLISCNNSNECICPKKNQEYQENVSDITPFDMGSGLGCCGWIISATDSITGKMTIYKPINIPQEMINHPMAMYIGTLVVLPETYTCYNCAADPNPNNPPKPMSISFVNILEYHRK